MENLLRRCFCPEFPLNFRTKIQAKIRQISFYINFLWFMPVLRCESQDSRVPQRSSIVQRITQNLLNAFKCTLMAYVMSEIVFPFCKVTEFEHIKCGTKLKFRPWPISGMFCCSWFDKNLIREESWLKWFAYSPKWTNRRIPRWPAATNVISIALRTDLWIRACESPRVNQGLRLTGSMVVDDHKLLENGKITVC